MSAHISPLVVILAAALGLAFLFGTVANRLRISPIVGYLLAGVAVGPFTPGYVADPELTLQLAELGVILLMFGVGLHFSLEDLASVRRVVLPGAFFQVIGSSGLGTIVAHLLFGWPWSAALVFGAALSVASTVVVTRALQERRVIASEAGRLAVAWLVVQDLLTVLALVLLPPLAPLLRGGDAAAHAASLATGDLLTSVGLTVVKLAAFFLLMWIVGRRLIPAILHYAAHTGSRELFRLAVLAAALVVAFGAAELFGVSIALGAFFAGMSLSGSPLSRRAAEETLPLRDAFAVLFFVSVGMVFNPRILVSAPLHLFATVAVVAIGTAAVAFALQRAFGVRIERAAFVAASLAQIGEFSFILINLGIGLAVVPHESRDLVLGASIFSILLNPVLLHVAGALAKPAPRSMPEAPAPEPLPRVALTGHTVLVGCGRVGGLIVQALKGGSTPLLVIEEAEETVQRLRAEGLSVLAGNGADERLLRAASLESATLLLIAIPEAFEAGNIVQQARRANPALEIVARAHFDAEVDHLLGLGANAVIMGEREIALAMLQHAGAPAPAQPSPAPLS